MQSTRLSRIIGEEKYAFYRRRVVKVESKNQIRPNTCSLFIDLKPLWLSWRILGAIPYSENADGSVTCNWISISMLYCFLAYIFVLYFLYHQLIAIHVELSAKDLGFMNTVFLSIKKYSSLYIVVTPFTLWLDAKKYQNFILQWMKFERNYVEVFCAKPETTRLKRQCWISVSSGLVLTFSLTIPFMTFFQLPIREQVVFTYCLLTVILLLPQIYFYSRLIEIFALDFRQNIYRKASNFENSITLWLQLRNSLQNFGPFTSINIIHVPTFTTIGVVALYGIMYHFFDEVAPFMRTSLMGFLFILIAVLLFTTTSGEKVRKLVGSDFISNFYLNRKSLVCYDENSRKYFKMWRVMLRSVDTDVTPHGFWNFSNEGFLSWSSLVITYLLILIQLEQGSQTETFQNNTRTSSIQYKIDYPN